MRKDYGTRTKMKDGGKLKMVTNKEGKKVPFFAAALPLGHSLVIIFSSLFVQLLQSLL